jgi:phosphonate transport system permease protein
MEVSTSWRSWPTPEAWLGAGSRWTATVLGLVGAGGIGFELMTSMRLFKYRNVAVILVAIVGLVVLTDAASTRIRKRYL